MKHTPFNAARRRIPARYRMLAALLLWAGPAAAQIDDMGILRDLLASDYESAVRTLDGWNQILIRNTGRLAPQQAAEMRARFEFPETLPEAGTLELAGSNYGQGLVTFLFEEDFIVEEVRLRFCSGRVASIQVLFDDTRSFGDTARIFGEVYGMGPPAPFDSHAPAFRYPLPGVTYDDEGGWGLDAGAPPVTVWNRDTREALYQPVHGGALITGQFWLTSRDLIVDCDEAPEEN